MTHQVKLYRRRRFITPPQARPNFRWHDLLFHILMAFHRPASWPAWMMGVVLCCWAGLVFGLWYPVAPNLAPLVSLSLLLFFGADWLLLAWLPRARRSFGPVNPQLLFMIIPRLLVAMVTVAPAAFGWPGWGLALFLGLELAGTMAYVWGLAVEPQRLSCTSLSITSPHLPAQADPIRLLHLSDFHLERLTRREEKILSFIEAARPDLIVISGDYLNASYRCEPEAVAQIRRLLAQLHAPYGVYAVLGTPLIDLPYIAPLHFQGTDIQLLRRDVVDIDLGEGRRLALLGLDCSHDMAHDGQLLKRLAAIAPADATRLLLYHSPELMPQAPQHGIHLYLCGHTHGGQLRLPGYGALFTSAATGKRYEMGRYDENGTTLYVSRGIGLEGLSLPRLRLFCPPEITLVTIAGERRTLPHDDGRERSNRRPSRAEV